MSAGPWRCSIYLDRLCRIVFQPIKPGFQHNFDIVLRQLLSVCFQREEGKEYVRLLKFLLLGLCISIGFGTDRDLPDGDLFSMCVRFCFGPHLGGVLAV